MNPRIIVGILLIALGIVAFRLPGHNVQHQGKVVDVGPVHLTRRRPERFRCPDRGGDCAGGRDRVARRGRQERLMKPERR